jgi:hypothetical protein
MAITLHPSLERTPPSILKKEGKKIVDQHPEQDA